MLEAVLPLIEKDLERSTLLRESLERHGRDLGTCWIVTPADHVTPIAAAFAGDPRWKVIAEQEVLRHRKPLLTALRDAGRRRQGNWYFQQLLKLAACARSTAAFCITLDADVIALRDITEDVAVPGGRALSQIEPPPQAHPHWYDGSAAVLGMPRSPWHNAVTPAILSPEVCRDLIAYLEQRKGRLHRDWTSFLMGRTPWSEYSLYNTFLEGTGRFDDYHVRIERPVIYGDAVWHPEDFAAWKGGRLEDRPLFTLVQSTAGVSVEEIRRRLAAPA